MQNLLVEIYRKTFTEAEKKMAYSLIPLSHQEMNKSIINKYDLLDSENEEKIGSIQMTLLLRESKKKLLNFEDSDEKIIKEATNKANVQLQRTVNSLKQYKKPSENGIFFF